jgi:RHS repeat-associated protein
MSRLTGTTTQYTFIPNQTYSNTYTYDAASNRTGLQAPDGSTTTYGYDILNRLTDQTSSWAGHFVFGYDDVSRRTSLTRPNGLNTSYSYDNLSRLLSVLHQQGANTVDGAVYTYDNAGNRNSKQNLLNGVTENYIYDAIYQLKQVTQQATTTESYTYDAVGNRLSSLNVATYSYDSSNHLNSSSDGVSYTYDNNGNTLTKTDASGTAQYAWDFENRLTSVTLPGSGGVVTFKYDPFGRRIQKSSATGTTDFAYDGANIIAELNPAGAIIAKYAQGEGIDQPLAMARNGVTALYDGDGLGSITSLYDSAGAQAATYNFTSFGTTTPTGSLFNPFQYTGREWDSETGLFYYRARYYDQGTGRFVSEDPMSFKGGINFYSYTINNPINFVDPSGLLAELYCDKIGSLRGGSRNSIFLFFADPTHCYLRVACHGKDVYLELYGPKERSNGTHEDFGIPHNDSPYNPDRAKNSTKHPLHPPAGMKCCEFEDRLMQAFDYQASHLDFYQDTGPNSNTFVNDIINGAGGTAEFPPNAFGVGDFGNSLFHTPLVRNIFNIFPNF